MLCMSKMLKMGKEHTDTFWLITSLILNRFSIRKSFGKLRLRAFQPYHQIKACQSVYQVQSMLCMSEMLEIDQVHLRTVMLCMSKMLKMGKEHTDTFWLITSLILNRFSIRKSFGKLRLRAFQPYHQILCILKHVRDVGDRSSTPKDCNAMYDVGDRSSTPKDCNAMYVGDVEDRSNTPTCCNAMYFNPKKF